MEGGRVVVDLFAICEVMALRGVPFRELDGFGVVVDIELSCPCCVNVAST